MNLSQIYHILIIVLLLNSWELNIKNHKKTLNMILNSPLNYLKTTICIYLKQFSIFICRIVFQNEITKKNIFSFFFFLPYKKNV